MREDITDTQKLDVESFIEVTKRTKVFCEECGEECKTGTPMWNGWFCYKGTYHLKCVPEDLKEKYGIRV